MNFHGALESAFGSLNWQPVANGLIHRFQIPGDRPNSKNGWYILLAGETAGCFGSWRTGITYNWSKHTPSRLLENTLISRPTKNTHTHIKNEHQKQHMAVAIYANELWSKSTPAKSSHPYLAAKGCHKHELRQNGDKLLIPIFYNGKIVNLQFISPNGEKRFLKGGKLKGCYALIGSPLNILKLYICEGWATGATIHEETGTTVACAMSSSNLLGAGQTLQSLHPNADLIIVGDDDRQTNGNPGKTAATRAATALGCGLVLPQWPANAPLSLTDLNDLHVWLRKNH